MITIDWGAFGIVAGVVLIAVTLLTVCYSGGVRLLETAGANVGARVGAYVCFAVCVAAVLFGLWVIVPQLHGG